MATAKKPVAKKTTAKNPNPKVEVEGEVEVEAKPTSHKGRCIQCNKVADHVHAGV